MTSPTRGLKDDVIQSSIRPAGCAVSMVWVPLAPSQNSEWQNCFFLFFFSHCKVKKTAGCCFNLKNPT